MKKKLDLEYSGSFVSWKPNGKEEVSILVRGTHNYTCTYTCSRMQQLSLGEKGRPCFLLNGCPREGFHYNYKTRVKGTLCHFIQGKPESTDKS